MSYFTLPKPSSPNASIKQKFEYNDYGEFVPKMQQPQQAIMQGRQQPVQQPDSFRVMNANKQSISNNSSIFQDPRKNKWTSTGDKPTQVSYDPSNYQRQAQQLYGRNNNYNSSASLSSAATQLYTAGGNNPSSQPINNNNNNNNNSLTSASPFQRASMTLLQPETLPTQQRSKYGSFHERPQHPPSLYIPPRIPAYNQNSSPLRRQREERAFQEELALQKNNNESQLYNKQIYNQLRYGYNNKNIRTHFEIAGAPKDTLQLGDGQNHFDAKPQLLINEAQFRRSVEKLLAKKMKQENNERVRSPANRVHGNSLKILERENRQYNLSEGDAVEQMMAVSSKLRNLKEYLLRTKDPMKISSVRQSIEKRLLAKAIQEDRKKRLIALLGLDIYSSPQRQNNSSSSNIRSSYGRMQ